MNLIRRLAWDWQSRRRSSRYASDAAHRRARALLKRELFRMLADYDLVPVVVCSHDSSRIR